MEKILSQWAWVHTEAGRIWREQDKSGTKENFEILAVSSERDTGCCKKKGRGQTSSTTSWKGSWLPNCLPFSLFPFLPFFLIFFFQPSFLKKKRFSLFLFMGILRIHLQGVLCCAHVCRSLQWPEEGASSLGTAVISHCALPSNKCWESNSDPL